MTELELKMNRAKELKQEISDLQNQLKENQESIQLRDKLLKKIIEDQEIATWALAEVRRAADDMDEIFKSALDELHSLQMWSNGLKDIRKSGLAPQEKNIEISKRIDEQPRFETDFE